MQSIVKGPTDSALSELTIGQAFDEAVADLAGRLARGPPVALRLAKMLLNRSAQGVGEAGLDLEALAFSVVTSTEDLFEGISAFMSKKEPKFKGK